MSALENKIPPPLIGVIIGAAMAVVAHFVPASRWEGAWHFLLAGAVSGAGFLVLALGFRALRQAKTTIDPVRIERASSLVTSGIYGYSRNPMYLGFALLLAGWALFLATPWAWAGPIAFVAFITRFQIKPEERVIRAKFGHQFDEFSQRVRRWI